MRLIVTGALGHIGSRLIRVLPTSIPDIEVVMIDDLSSQRYASLFKLPDQGRYRFLQGDVTTMGLGPHFEGAQAVVHLAAITDATSSFGNRETVERNNYEGTRQVAEACIRANVPLIHLSSTSVYGTQAARVDEDCPEEDLKPQSPYAETKLREERLVLRLAQNGLRAVSCRFGTITGTSPGMRFHTAVNKFCWQAVMGIPLTVWRTAYDQRRPYLDLHDAVRAIVFFLENRIFDGRIHNVVTQNATVRDVLGHIRDEVPGLSIEFVDAEIMNQLSYDVDSGRIASAGFRFEGNIQHGIADTVALLRRANSLK